MMSTDWLFIVTRPSEASRGTSGTLRGGGGESDVAIPRFLCDSPHPYQLRTASF
jgi:hypothetical protein